MLLIMSTSQKAMIYICKLFDSDSIAAQYTVD